MLSPADVERYRRMFVGERSHETALLMAADEAFLATLPPEECDRRLRLLTEEQERSNRALLLALAGR